MFKRFSYPVAGMISTLLALTGVALLNGGGDANRSPFAPDQTAIVSSDSQAPVSVAKPAKDKA